MNKVTLQSIARTYKNNGQHAEQVVRYTLTGEIVKADNKPYTECGDVFDMQVKSARATVCYGTDIEAHIARDAATSYAYVTKDFNTMYVMSPAEWKTFISAFSTVTRDSKKRGGRVKLRLKDETSKMITYLQAHAG